MEAVPMQIVLDAAAKAGVVIGHDGCAVPVEVDEVMPAECHCDGSGVIPVRFGGQIIARPPCPGCADG